MRCRNETELAQLEGQHASQIVVETHEESLTLIYHLLRTLKLPEVKIIHLIEDIRKKHYEILRQYFPGTFTEEMSEEGIPLKQLRPIILLADTDAVNHTLGDIANRLNDVEIIAVRRGKNYFSHPKANFKPQAGDVVILYATPENLESAEEILL